MFKDETSSAKLATFTCACCAESALHADCVIASLDDFDPSLLHSPDRQNDQHMLNDYFDKDCPLPQLPFSESDSPLHDLMVDPAGVRQSDTGKFQLLLCGLCRKKLNKGKRPALSLVNRTFLGDVPDELKDLTVVEEAMIARCRAKCWIVQLKEENQDLQLSPPVADIITPICVIFVGSCPPT
ncbi:hypothetical protein F4604DRAFT_1813097, partial [Suillus subluteus]